MRGHLAGIRTSDRLADRPVTITTDPAFRKLDTRWRQVASSTTREKKELPASTELEFGGSRKPVTDGIRTPVLSCTARILYNISTEQFRI